jgi:hypothetical protein
LRIGVYFQWLGSYLANVFLPDEVSSSLSANSVFILAIFLAIVRHSFDYRVNSADVLVLLQLAYGYFFSVFSLFGFRTRSLSDGKVAHLSTFGVYIRICIAVAISCYSAWFWCDGVAALPQPVCEEVIFFFAKWEVLKGIRTFFKIAAILISICYGAIAVTAIATVARYLIFRLLFVHTKTQADLRFWERFREKAMNHPKMLLEQQGYVQTTKFPYFLSYHPTHRSSCC